MEDIYQEIVRIKSEGETAAMATIISIKGSTPREVGSKMLIKSDGTILGSIGGGNLELLVCQEGLKAMKEGKSKVLHFDLTGKEALESETIETGMICSGDILYCSCQEGKRKNFIFCKNSKLQNRSHFGNTLALEFF